VIFFTNPITLENGNGGTYYTPGINVSGTSAISTISPLTPSGTDTISDLALIDAVGNRRDYTASDLTALGLPNSITFTNAAATVTPTVSLSIDNTDVNLANGTGTVTFAFSEAPVAFTLVADTSAVGGTLSNLQPPTPRITPRPLRALPTPTSAMPW
jgi:hypothetical protein